MKKEQKVMTTTKENPYLPPQGGDQGQDSRDSIHKVDPPKPEETVPSWNHELDGDYFLKECVEVAFGD